MIKVKELIEELEKLDPERFVVVASDQEGNKYMPMGLDFTTGLAMYECNGEIDFYSEDDSYDDEAPAAAVSAVILWPGYTTREFWNDRNTGV